MANELVKKPYIDDILTADQQREWFRCSMDCKYFLENYVKVQHPTRGSVLFDLREYQERTVDNILEHRNVICLFPRQSGKALALDTKIPTPDGWTTMGEVKEGDMVLGNDGLPTKVSFITEVMYNHNCYKITFDNGETIIADEDHKWEVSHSDWDIKPKVLTTKEMLVKHESNRKHSNTLYIDITKPLRLPKKDLPIDPYTLGVWLGDDDSSSNRITGLPEDLSEIMSHIDSDVYTPLQQRKDRETANCVTQTVSGLRPQLRENNLLKNKHIPQQYLRGSIKQRIDLLRGLMDTDGHCGKNGACEFYQKNEALIDDVRELLSSLGIKNRKRVKTIDNEQYYTLSFTTRRFYVFNLKRKRERQKNCKGHPKNLRHHIKTIEAVESVPVRCLQVENDNHIFLCGNSMIPTHNTATITGYLLWKSVFNRDLKIGVAAHKGSGAKEIIERFKYAYEFLPMWMKPGAVTYNVFDVSFDNGSSIISQTTTENTFRGLSLSLIYMDELAFVKPRIAEEFWASLLPSTTAGEDGELDADGNPVEPVQVLITSTPNGSEGLFARLWYKAERTPDDSMFKAVRVHNSEVPGRDEGFKKKMLKTMTELKYKQEFECVSGDTKIDIDGSYISIGELYKCSDLIGNDVCGNNGKKILTPNGYESFDGIVKTKHNYYLEVVFEDGTSIKCSTNHKFLTPDGFKPIPEAKEIVTENGYVKVESYKKIYDEIYLYDIINAGSTYSYFTNGVVSHNCAFLSNKGTLINSEVLESIYGIEPVGELLGCRLYDETPFRNRRLGIAIDVAEGIGGNGDYSTIEIFDLDTFEQVAEWDNNEMSTSKFAKYIIQLFTAIDKQQPKEVYYTVESNPIGLGVLNLLQESTATVLDKFELVSESYKRAGILTTNKNKLAGCSLFKDLVENDRMTIRSKKLLSELKFFVKKGASFSAETGMHDDLVMGCVLLCNMTKIIAKSDDDVHNRLNKIDSAECVTDGVLDSTAFSPLVF